MCNRGIACRRERVLENVFWGRIEKVFFIRFDSWFYTFVINYFSSMAAEWQDLPTWTVM